MILCVLLSLLSLAHTSVVAAQGSVTDYAPSINVQCPTDPLLRVFTPQNQTLHPQEQSFINSKTDNVLPGAWKSWLGDYSQIGYNSTGFGNFSKVGIAVSGGGHRAAQYGAGVLSGLDARNDSAKSAGTGGLFQVASYWTGLSGGSWLTGSLALNDWPTSKDLVFGNGNNLSGWLLDLDLALPHGLNVFDEENQDFYGSILWSVRAKAAKGIDTSITDPWARTISYHFLNQTSRDNFFSNDSSHGAGQLWSHIPQVSSYQKAVAPFPIIVADSRPVGSQLTTTPPLNQTVYEITPLEFGSWDPNLSSMVNITFAGTHLTEGKPDNTTSCVTGFDQAGFMMGTSASLFNELLNKADDALDGFGDDESKGLVFMLKQLLGDVNTRADDVANWPNPFHSIKPDSFVDSKATWLELIDGGLNLENVPLNPLFVRARHLDTIIAIDGSADEDDNWPNGTALITTKNRLSTFLPSSHQQFPPIPATVDDFVSTGVNQRPTFFGCDPHSIFDYPLVIYLPNSPPLTGDNPATNYGTFQLKYSAKQTQIFLDQTHANTVGGFTPNSNSPDINWGKCLQCAAVDRARFQQNTTSRSSICQQCFSQYCYDPLHPPSSSELPNRKLKLVDPDPQGSEKVTTFIDAHKAPLIGGLVGLVATIGILIASLIWWKKRKGQTRYNRVIDDDGAWKHRRTDVLEAENYELPSQHSR